ncbi:CRISPR-associated endoribonuclease Cas6 [Ruminiclostridium sufflavum DSM 19573]|uniref:CRISPR-associated endoribonuclease Cas6 n=1 Tax=Ruminiclostridium sufflavum DSM 19573 TaxID=1121337 RepID=A0A318XKJ6_9FIRM|nr:CRISPR-associated endoribonuclease Cas6 [Ruminiclostridium sufflavum]PYG86978.1 CRISPR-associated endoribonuclease Cas6 [Ruminiclostridium sufflavum DSM 19573]
MLYYEAKISICLKADTPADNIYKVISNTINYTFLKDEALKKMHEENSFKGYTFCNPYPVEKEKVYLAQKVYLFRLRSIDLKFILKVKNLLPKCDEYFKVLAFELYNCKPKHTDKIKTLTPAVSTLYNRNWTKEDGIEIIRERIHNNAVRKIKSFSKNGFQEPAENFIQCIVQTNRKPIVVPYKESSLIGNKFELSIKPDPASQELAQVILGAGVLEKNSLGLGFCIASA